MSTPERTPRPSIAVGSDASGSELPSHAASSNATTRHASSAFPSIEDLDRLHRKFKNFDLEEVYNTADQIGKSSSTQNFVVHFDSDKAEIAWDLSDEDFQVLVAEGKDNGSSGGSGFGSKHMPARWINVWNPKRQRQAITTIGERYGFSRRLILSIWAWDRVKERLQSTKATDAADRSSKKYIKDIETGLHGRLNTSHPAAPPGESMELRPGNTDYHEQIFEKDNLTTFQMMQTTINYTSIDKGRLFSCFGANWLHKPLEKDAKKLIPPKHWSWLAMCNDNTVLSFHEDCLPSKSRTKEDADEELQNSRSNTLKVLWHLSECGQRKDMYNMMQATSIRESMLGNNYSQRGLEGASSLFYYLFEDYAAALVILNNTKKTLDDISYQILHSGDPVYNTESLGIIPRLYRLNKELRQLNHLFTSFNTLINTILSQENEKEADVFVTNPCEPAVRERGNAVRLSDSANDRFRRFQVQLKSLMLDNIKDCLDEKESLQNTYFNLTNQKDSKATERLTRSATLLAKLSVFFLPISFMTSYFSIQIPSLTNGYTAWTYWGTFIVIASLSFFTLLFFNLFAKILGFLASWTEGTADRIFLFFFRTLLLKKQAKHQAREEEDEWR